MTMNIGILGMGIIGQAWAPRYAAAGVLGGVWNRTSMPQLPFWKACAATLAAEVDIVQIVVADPPAVEGLLTQILPGLKAGKYVVQSSTIDPASSGRFRAMVRATGARYVEAPFTGSKLAAEEGKTVFFFGGDAADIAAVEPTLSLVSETRFTIGTGEQAATVKLAMNLNIAAQMEAYSESLSFVRRAGIDDETYFSVLEKNVSYSGLAKLKEPKLRAEDFSPQFSVKHMHKDMRLASTSAVGGVADYPLLELVRARLNALETQGHGDEDISALIKLMSR
jgi:3-hydroxyisobutyrate dehydrogenase-like beta-hydroxyacid dehydrogenase